MQLLEVTQRRELTAGANGYRQALILVPHRAQSEIVLLQRSKVIRKDRKMANQKTTKCAHIPCLCDVPVGEEYCGDACRDAGGEDVEIACQCNHPACPLTLRPFASQGTAKLAS